MATSVNCIDLKTRSKEGKKKEWGREGRKRTRKKKKEQVRFAGKKKIATAYNGTY